MKYVPDDSWEPITRQEYEAAIANPKAVCIEDAGHESARPAWYKTPVIDDKTERRIGWLYMEIKDVKSMEIRIKKTSVSNEGVKLAGYHPTDGKIRRMKPPTSDTIIVPPKRERCAWEGGKRKDIMEKLNELWKQALGEVQDED